MKLRTEMVDGDVFARGKSSLDKLRRLRHDAMAAHAYKQAVKQVLGYYPESASPEYGESLDCKSASMARHTCNNIEKRADEILAGWMGEDGG